MTSRSSSWGNTTILTDNQLSCHVDGQDWRERLQKVKSAKTEAGCQHDLHDVARFVSSPRRRRPIWGFAQIPKNLATDRPYEVHSLTATPLRILM